MTAVKFDYLGPDQPFPTIHRFKVIDLEPRELARCRELSFGNEGYMCEDLDEILQTERRYQYRNSQAILLGEGWGRLEKGAKLRTWPIYGWALLQPIYRRSKYSAQFFVDPLHRGKGYGRMLLEKANYYSSQPIVYVDDENEGFFKKHPNMFEEMKEKDMSA